MNSSSPHFAAAGEMHGGIPSIHVCLRNGQRTYTSGLLESTWELVCLELERYFTGLHSEKQLMFSLIVASCYMPG